MDYTITWVGCHQNNFEPGGAVDPVTGIKYKPTAIVNHVAEGSLGAVKSWFWNPGAEASTNYIVGKNGEILQFVRDGVDRPFANGAVKNPTWKGFVYRPDGKSIVNPNRHTISIEREGYTSEPLTDKQYDAILWLHKKLITDWNIPVDREHIIGHNEIDSIDRAHCPGKHFPWSRLMSDLTVWKKEMDEVNKLTWEQELGLKSVASLAKKTGVDGEKIIKTPETWTAEKMMESAPTWLVMTLLDRISK